jgi:hypothetical protein
MLDDFIEAFAIFQNEDVNHENRDLVFNFILPNKIKKENLIISMLKHISLVLYNENNYKLLNNNDLNKVVNKLHNIIENFIDTDELEEGWEQLTSYLLYFQEVLQFIPYFTSEELKNQIWAVLEA